MFKIWCEWDYGQDDCVFTSEKKGLTWLWAQMIANEGLDYLIESLEVGSIEDLVNEGLAGSYPITIDPQP